MNRLVVIFIFIIYTHLAYSSIKCNSLKNVTMSVRPRDGESYNTTITGCIERQAFDGAIVEAYIRQQLIPRLGPDSVKNMKHLHSVTFDDCGVQVIEPGAFRNVPNLKSVRVANSELAVVRAGVFNPIPNLYALKLHRNKIELVEDGAFSNLPTLRKLYVDHNKLKRWEREWFSNSTSVEVLDFRFNFIASLPTLAFSDFHNIKEICFDYNDLETIESDAFRNVRRLEYLGLRHNRLKDLNADVFPNQIIIKVMTVDANYFNFIPSTTLARLLTEVVSLSGNPWKCPCLEQLLRWLGETNSTTSTDVACARSDVPVCSFASSFTKTCTESVDRNLTTSYLDKLKEIVPPLHKLCARLD